MNPKAVMDDKEKTNRFRKFLSKNPQPQVGDGTSASKEVLKFGRRKGKNQNAVAAKPSSLTVQEPDPLISPPVSLTNITGSINARHQEFSHNTSLETMAASSMALPNAFNRYDLQTSWANINHSSHPCHTHPLTAILGPTHPAIFGPSLPTPNPIYGNFCPYNYNYEEYRRRAYSISLPVQVLSSQPTMSPTFQYSNQELDHKAQLGMHNNSSSYQNLRSSYFESVRTESPGINIEKYSETHTSSSTNNVCSEYSTLCHNPKHSRPALSIDHQLPDRQQKELNTIKECPYVLEEDLEDSSMAVHVYKMNDLKVRRRMKTYVLHLDQIWKLALSKMVIDPEFLQNIKGFHLGYEELDHTLFKRHLVTLARLFIHFAMQEPNFN